MVWAKKVDMWMYEELQIINYGAISLKNILVD